MKFFRNRTVTGVICILLSLAICFGITPMFTRSASGKTTVLRPIANGNRSNKDVVESEAAEDEF